MVTPRREFVPTSWLAPQSRRRGSNSPRPAVSVSAVARLFPLARSRHTLRGWLRYRVALLFAPHPVYRAFVLQARHRYYTLTDRR